MLYTNLEGYFSQTTDQIATTCTDISATCLVYMMLMLLLTIKKYQIPICDTACFCIYSKIQSDSKLVTTEPTLYFDYKKKKTLSELLFPVQRLSTSI